MKARSYEPGPVLRCGRIGCDRAVSALAKVAADLFHDAAERARRVAEARAIGTIIQLLASAANLWAPTHDQAPARPSSEPRTGTPPMRPRA